jgi:hypothetical protein
LYLWRWILVATVLVIGWAIVLVVLRLAHSPLPRPTSASICGYWLIRAIVWAVILISGVSGSYFVLHEASLTTWPVTFWSLLSAFATGSLAWAFWLLIYAVMFACIASRLC